MTIRRIALLIGLFASITFAASAAPPTYRVQEITPPAGDRTYHYPKAMNDLGQFIGDSSKGCCGEEYAVRGYMWNPATGIFKLLRASAGELDSRSSSSVFDINNRSQIVGVSANLENYYGRATIWTNGTPRFLSRFFPDEFQTVARAINDKGQIVGECDHQQRTFAVMWHGNTKRDLGIERS